MNRELVPLSRIWLLVTALAGSFGCGAKNPDVALATAATIRRDPKVISRAELDATIGVTNVWEAVVRLRPAFLRDQERRSLRSTDPRPTVRVDNADFGSLDALKQISIGDVQEVRYLDPSEATATFGTGTGRAVIQIVTRRLIR